LELLLLLAESFNKTALELIPEGVGGVFAGGLFQLIVCLLLP